MNRRSLLHRALLCAPLFASLAACGSSKVSPSTAIASTTLTTATTPGPTTTTTPTVAEITVAAASDLRPAFEELGKAFTTSSGTKVTFTFGSSGQLSQQVNNGAPFDLFASASVSYVDDVIAKGRGVASTKADYAFGRIVLWSPKGVTLPTGTAQLPQPQYRRIAIANPDHAPYGVAAKQALVSIGVYDQVKDRLVFGENISDTFEITKSGNADVGIIALSLALANGGTYTLIPAELHKPLEQALVVTNSGARGDAAAAFAASISSAAGRNIMARYGFLLPGEAAAGA